MLGCIAKDKHQSFFFWVTTSIRTMHHAHSRPLQFSDCHGCNVIVKSCRTLAEANYLKAHGQFITKGDLRRDQRIDLIFEGKGILKFNAFPQRSQAVDWVRSKQPLPRGCRRVRFNGIVHYTISVPNPGRCVLIECVRQSGRERFTFDAGPTTTLSFDIEFGDMAVHIDSSLTFDSFCHSPHIKLGRANNRSTASMVHYNPSSLCCLEDAPLIPGVTFRVEVQNSSHKTDTGSYIRLCVARQLSPYENNDQTLSCGSPTHPSLTGRRRLIAYNSCAEFIVQILQDGLIISRPNSRNIETMHFLLDEQCDHTLWFEIHKVSLRVWQVRERDIVDLDNSYLSLQLDLDDPPPSEPAPPPPRLALRKPTPCRRRPNHRTNCAHRKTPRDPMPVGTHNDGFISDASVACASNHSTVDRRYGSYVSMDNPRSADCYNSDTCLKFTSINSTMRHDLLCDNYIDTTPLPSIGSNLITLSSSESLVFDHDNSNKTQHKSSYEYEEPGRVWKMNSSTRIPFLNSKDLHEKTTLSPMTNIIKTRGLHANGSDKCKCTANKSHLVHHNHSSDSHTNNSAGAGFVSDIPQYTGGRNTSMTKNHLSNLDRTLMWVAKVNENQDIWSSQEDVGGNIKSKDCRSFREYHGRHRCGPANAICQSEINRLADSEVRTSSVWFSDLDDGLETMQHNLNINFVPVQGQLKCHSYYSDSVHTLAGSRKSFTESTNTLTDPCPDLTDASKSTHNQRKSRLSASTATLSYLSGNDMNSNNQKTTLKKTLYCSTESVPGSDSTCVNHETRPKSVNSGGFDVDEADADSVSKDSTDPPDEITHLKHLAQLENMTTPFLGLSRSCSKSHRNKEQQTHNKSIRNEADEKSRADVAESYQAALTSTNKGDRGHELREQILDTKSGVTCMPNHWRSSRPNIVGNIISNSPATYLSIGPTIKLPAEIHPIRSPESTDDERTSLVSASILPFSNVNDNDINSNSQEMTLKKTFCCSTEFLCDNNSACVNHETRPKSVNSDGFNVDEGDAYNISQDCVDPSDEITDLKHLAQLGNLDITRTERHLQEFDLANKTSNKSLPPKPCSQHPCSQYCLAGRLSPVPITKPVSGLPRRLQNLDRNRSQQGLSGYSQSNYDANEKFTVDATECSQEPLTITNRRDRGNELSEQAIDINSEICMRNQWRSSRRNIVESVISNSSAVCSSIEPTINLPNGIQPIARSETLKRNLDYSPLNKNWK